MNTSRPNDSRRGNATNMVVDSFYHQHQNDWRGCHRVSSFRADARTGAALCYQVSVSTQPMHPL